MTTGWQHEDMNLQSAKLNKSSDMFPCPNNDYSNGSNSLLLRRPSPIAQSQFSQSRKFVMVTSLADSAAAATIPPSALLKEA